MSGSIRSRLYHNNYSCGSLPACIEKVTVHVWKHRQTKKRYLKTYSISLILVSDLMVSNILVSNILVSSILVSSILISNTLVSNILASNMLVSNVLVSNISISNILVSKILVSKILVSNILVSKSGQAARPMIKVNVTSICLTLADLEKASSVSTSCSFPSLEELAEHSDSMVRPHCWFIFLNGDQNTLMRTWLP